MLTLGRGGDNLTNKDSCSFTCYGNARWIRFHCFRLLYVLLINLPSAMIFEVIALFLLL